jgi:outer membrane protein OmpA-like peptidoglycan-associated protein
MAIKRGTTDDAEKPFWISFADLMTALMVLFLVALSVAFNEANKQREEASRQRDEAIRTQKELEKEREKLERLYAELARREKERDTRREQRNAEVKSFLDEVDKVVRRHEGVRLDRERHVVDFGSRALFRRGSHELTPEQTNALRKLVPELLEVTRSDVGQRWLKRIVVEGFTSSDWTYLDNLNLSLQRSQRVMCVLLTTTWGQPTGGSAARLTLAPELERVSHEDEILIKQLFLVGGYSSNSTKPTPEESRRIELRIELYQLEDLDENGRPPKRPESTAPIGRCALGS